jgi:hypothetical protein
LYLQRDPRLKRLAEHLHLYHDRRLMLYDDRFVGIVWLGRLLDDFDLVVLVDGNRLQSLLIQIFGHERFQVGRIVAVVVGGVLFDCFEDRRKARLYDLLYLRGLLDGLPKALLERTP